MDVKCLSHHGWAILSLPVPQITSNNGSNGTNGFLYLDLHQGRMASIVLIECITLMHLRLLPDAFMLQICLKASTSKIGIS